MNPKRVPKSDPEPRLERLNKVIAEAGLASRRAADRMIAEGRVTVNGSIVSEMGLRVDVGRDAVKVDGRRLPTPRGERRVLMLFKPRGYVTTLSDPEGRPTVSDLVGRGRGRLFPVGRLDLNSEGLLLLTDDGELARDLMHPSRGVPKTYLVKVRGLPDTGALERLRRGVPLEGERPARVDRVRVVRRAANAWVEVTVHEGRKHLVRRLLEAVGHPVSKLRRVGYGDLSLAGLVPGKWRWLTPDEVSGLRRSVGKSKPPRRR